AALLEGERQVHPVPLAAGQDPGGLLLIRSLEPESGRVGAAGDLGAAGPDVGLPVRDGLPDVLGRIDPAARLIDVRDLYCLADPDRSAVRLLLPHDHLEQRRLANPVRPDDTDYAVGREAEA